MLTLEQAPARHQYATAENGAQVRLLRSNIHFLSAATKKSKLNVRAFCEVITHFMRTCDD